MSLLTRRHCGPGFGERLAEVIAASTPLAIGIDPREAQLPPEFGDALPELEAHRAFAFALLELAADEGVRVTKPQSAFFERMGPDGVALYAEVLCHARSLGYLVIADVKRGDIASTAKAYAAAYLGPDAPFRADAITINPYLGVEGLDPFFERAEATGSGTFVLCRTSNPGAAILQDRPFTGEAGASGETLAERVANLIADRNRAFREGVPGPHGAVIGATVTASTLAALRGRLGDAWVLAPGIGAQGAQPNDLTPLRTETLGGGVCVPVSRGIAGAWQESPDVPWRFAIRARLQSLIAALASET